VIRCEEIAPARMQRIDRLSGAAASEPASPCDATRRQVRRQLDHLRRYAQPIGDGVACYLE
jgi:hypothetical protein